MEKEEILKDLEKIFKNVLEDESITITGDMNAEDIKGWDSLSHINIIEEVEKHFKVHFSIGEIVVLKTISNLINLIQQKIS